MPWLGSIYLALFAAIGISSVYLEYRDGEKPWLLWCDSFAGVSLVYLFASYWHRGLRDALGMMAPLLFLIAMGWEIADTPRELKGVFGNPELTPLEKKIAPVLGIGICIPVYIIAGLAVFR